MSIYADHAATTAMSEAAGIVTETPPACTASVSRPKKSWNRPVKRLLP